MKKNKTTNKIKKLEHTMKNRKEVREALFTLTKERIKHRYPNAQDRSEVINAIIDKSEFTPARITGYIDHIIRETYADVFATRIVCEKLNEALNSIPAPVVEQMSDVKSMISDGEELCKKVLGENTYFPSSNDIPPPRIIETSTEIPF